MRCTPKRRYILSASVLALGAAACGARQPRNPRMPATGTMMAGDSMVMMAEPMLPAVRAELDSLASPVPGIRLAALSAHDTVMAGVLRAIRADLMHLGMHRDSGYEALADSIVKDQALIAGAPAAQQAELLGRHLDRVRRLLSVYDAMVAKGRRG